MAQGSVADVFGADEIAFPSLLDCGQSNTTLKLMLPLACLSEHPVSVEGSGSLSAKSYEAFSSYLQRLGASAQCIAHALPMKVQGPLSEREIVYFPQFGSQFLSGMLLASPFSEAGMEIGIEGKVRGWEYVEWTLEIMKACGINFEVSGEDFIRVEPGQEYSPLAELEVPASSYLSSYLLLAGALAGKVVAQGELHLQQFERLLSSFGAATHQGEASFTASAGVISGIELSAPELGMYLPHALVLAGFSESHTVLNGVSALDPHMGKRLRLLLRELSKMGLKYEEANGQITLSGGKLSGVEIQPEGDAAVAMALSAASLYSSGQSRIRGAQCVEKSYPGFFKDLSALGAIIR